MEANADPAVRLAAEMLELLVAAHYLSELGTMPLGEDVSANLRNVKLCQLLINDVVMRLCKFRDDDNRNWGFREVEKYMLKRSQLIDRATQAREPIKRFLASTRNLEAYRSQAIAHLAKQGASGIKFSTDLRNAVGLAVAVVDALSGKTLQYSLLTVDLRHTILSSSDA